jgi:hypothetical protein
MSANASKGVLITCDPVMKQYLLQLHKTAKASTTASRAKSSAKARRKRKADSQYGFVENLFFRCGCIYIYLLIIL